MKDENKPDPTTTDEKPPAPQAMWEKKDAFAVTQAMRQVVLAGIKATELELESLRRRLEKATYGG